jgi:hypothetical protein
MLERTFGYRSRNVIFSNLHIILVPLAIFLYFFNPNILNIQYIEWLLEGDLGQHFIGWHAFRYDQWR